MTIGKKLLLGALSLGLAGYVACTDANTNNTPVKSKYDVTPDEVKPIKWNHKSIAFVIDTSGSMNDKLNSKRKIDAAKETLLTMLKIYNEHNNKNNDIEAGLFCFNGSKVETLNPITKFNYSRLEKEVRSLSADGGTPIGLSLATAEQSLDNNATGKKYIVLLTDGENNEGKSPEEIFRMINESNEKTGDFKTQLYIIAFDTDKNNFKGLEKLGANVSEAKSVEALVKEMNKNTNLILEKMPE